MLAGFLIVTAVVLPSLIFFTSYSSQTRDDRSQAKVETPSPITPSAKLAAAREVSSLNKDIKTFIQTKDRRGLEEKLAQRKTRIKKMMSEDPASALAQTLEGKKLRDQLPNELKNQVETETTVEGTLGVAILDDFKNKSVKYEYSVIKDDKTRVNIHFLKDASNIKPRSRVRTKGFVIDDQMLIPPSDKEVELISEDKKVLGESTPIKVAVILSHFQNPINPTGVPENVRQVTFTDPDSINTFFQETSAGKYHLEGEVYGEYALPYPDTACDYTNQAWRDSAKQLASQDGFNEANYDIIIHFIPYTFTCNFGGLALIGETPAGILIDGNYSKEVVSHEIGHVLGLGHANAFVCHNDAGQQVPISTNCQIGEYGDPFDVMGGNGFGMHHFSMYHKAKIHFSDSTNIQTVTSNGQFELTANAINSSALKTLYIPITSPSPNNESQGYYLEFRRNTGIFDQFDTQYNLDGVLIRKALNYSAQSDWVSAGSKLIDTTPEQNQPVFTNAALGVGQTFIDPFEGVKITTLGVNDTTANVKVEFIAKECARGTSTLFANPDRTFASPGESILYYFYLTNNDSTACGASDFNLDLIMPENLSTPTLHISQRINPGETIALSYYVLVNPTASPGTHFISQTYSQVQTGWTTNLNAVLEVNPAQPSPTQACIHPTGKQADFNNDGKVDLRDYSILVSEFLTSKSVYMADANCDHMVDLNDYSIFLSELLK